MSTSSDLLIEVDKIKKDRVHGSRELACMALHSLRRSLDHLKSEDRVVIINYLLTAARLFAEARPSMASIANSVAAVVGDVLKAEKSGERLKDSILNSVDKQFHRLEIAFEEVVSNTASLIKNGFVVVTCSYSSTVLEALVESNRVGSLGVLALHSPSTDGSISYGSLLCDKLRENNVSVEVVYEKENERLGPVNMAIIGADSIFPDGSVLNGSPSLMLAEEMLRRGVPFYVACETWKMNPKRLGEGVRSVEAGMDIVPAKLVTGLVIEHGVMEPFKVNGYAVELLKRLKVVL